MSPRCSHLLARALVCLIAGCGPARIAAPSFSPEEAARQALAEYDSNGDGFLDAKELERCPALKDTLKNLDKNRKRISADELAQRFTALRDPGIGLVGLPCRVTLNGKPLDGATVTLKPEKFMGEAFKPASGISDANGRVELRMEGQSVSGTHWGYFRIEVSKKDSAGKETLPAVYNTSTILGQEVAPDRKGPLVLKLSTQS